MELGAWPFNHVTASRTEPKKAIIDRMKEERNSETDGKAGEVSAPPLKVLIVDNDQALAYAMEESLTKVGHPCTVATSGNEGARKIETDMFDIIVTDLVMNDVDGMEILSRVRQNLPDAQTIMVTGHATISKAVEAMQQGAFNFLEKPITPNKLRAVVEKAVDAVRLKQQNTELQERLDEKFGFEGIIYASDKMKQVIDRLKRIAPTDASVLITGESGTGKEVIAQAIHQNSPRKGKRIVALNCAAVAENLVESELFGHVKGAYTDAVADRMGAFEYANGGTLFLDEIGDMPLPTQIKLLRVLEDSQITRVGDNKTTKVNVRMVSAIAPLPATASSNGKSAGKCLRASRTTWQPFSGVNRAANRKRSGLLLSYCLGCRTGRGMPFRTTAVRLARNPCSMCLLMRNCDGLVNRSTSSAVWRCHCR